MVFTMTKIYRMDFFFKKKLINRKGKVRKLKNYEKSSMKCFREFMPNAELYYKKQYQKAS